MIGASRRLDYDYVFLGSKKLGLDMFKAAYAQTFNQKWLVICPDDTRDQRSVFFEFSELCQDLNVEFKIAQSASNLDTLIEPARVALVCGWYWILPSRILEIFSQGVWGVHHSLLPKFRGGSPLVWALMLGEETVGSSFFRISEGIDSGGILAQVKTRVADSDNIGSLLGRLNDLAVGMVTDYWPRILAGSFELLIQDESSASHYPIRSEKDGQLEWSRPSREIYNFVRAQTSPYPGAYSFHGGQKVRIMSCQLSLDKNVSPPGHWKRLPNGSISIACGQATEVVVPATEFRGADGGSFSFKGDHQFLPQF